MCRLISCIPIFKGGGIKKCKKMCMCVGVKIALILVKNVCFGVKKGYK